MQRALVRVPIPVVILLVFSLISGIWWRNNRHMDFMTPPTEARLTEIREKIESSFPQADRVEDAISVPVIVPPPPPPPPPPPEPEIDLGNLTSPPDLQHYAEHSSQGPAHLIELAEILEKKGEPQRALLAWERVMDFTKPDAAQATTALAAIKRLRPTLPVWNLKPETAIQLELQASAGKKLTKSLTASLQAAALELESASSGIVKIKTKVTVGKSSSLNKKPTPVALWLNGPGKKPISTEVLSFTVDAPEKLREEIHKSVFVLVSNYLAKSTAYTPPTALDASEISLDALTHRVTRLCWKEFATHLHPLPKKAGESGN